MTTDPDPRVVLFRLPEPIDPLQDRAVSAVGDALAGEAVSLAPNDPCWRHVADLARQVPGAAIMVLVAQQRLDRVGADPYAR